MNSGNVRCARPGHRLPAADFDRRGCAAAATDRSTGPADRRRASPRRDRVPRPCRRALATRWYVDVSPVQAPPDGFHPARTSARGCRGRNRVRESRAKIVASLPKVWRDHISPAVDNVEMDGIAAPVTGIAHGWLAGAGLPLPVSAPARTFPPNPEMLPGRNSRLAVSSYQLRRASLYASDSSCSPGIARNPDRHRKLSRSAKASLAHSTCRWTKSGPPDRVRRD